MKRFAVLALSIVCVVAQQTMADEPLNVAAEQAKINQEFYQAIAKASRDRAGYDKANAARNAALTELVAKAEKAKSQEHGPLAQAYQALQRLDDAVREARAAVAKKPDDVASQTVLIYALSAGGKPDEAEKALEAAEKVLPNHAAFSGMRQSLAFGYHRAGKFDKAVEYITAALEQQWSTVAASPAAGNAFRNLAGNLAESSIRGKIADKALPTIDKFLERATKGAAKQPELAPLVEGLTSAKVRLLVAAERRDDARKLADELLAAADKRLRAQSDDATAVAAAASARRTMIQIAGPGEAGAAAIDNYHQFVQEHLAKQSESAEFIGMVLEAASMASGRLVAAGKLDDAEKLLKNSRERLSKLKPEGEAAKSAAARATSSIGSLLARLVGDRKRAALIGKPYFPILEAAWLNGSALKPEELRGKVVLLDFWAVWCGPCIATFPHLRQWNERYGEKGLVIIGVTKRYEYGWDADAKRIKREESLEPAKEDEATAAFVKHHELKHRIAVMPDTEFTAKYEVTGIPQAVLIDRDGSIRMIKVGSGEANAAQLEAAIRQLLGMPEQAAAAK